MFSVKVLHMFLAKVQKILKSTKISFVFILTLNTISIDSHSLFMPCLIEKGKDGLTNFSILKNFVAYIDLSKKGRSRLNFDQFETFVSEKVKCKTRC